MELKAMSMAKIASTTILMRDKNAFLYKSRNGVEKSSYTEQKISEADLLDKFEEKQ